MGVGRNGDPKAKPIRSLLVPRRVVTCRRDLATGIEHIGPRTMNAAMARRDAEVGRWIHWLSVNQHFEIQMRPIGDTGITHDAEFLPSHDRRVACGEYWTDHSEMAVDPDIAIVLHQHLDTTGTLVLNADQRAGFGGK